MPARSRRARDDANDGVGHPGPGCPAAQQTLQLSRPADSLELRHIRHRVEDWAEQHALPEDVVIDLQLALGEAVANGMEHAYAGMRPGTVDVEVRIRQDDDAALLVRVTDHGRWRPVPMVNGYRGRGLSVIERLARRVQVLRTGWGTEVCFEIPL